MAYLLRKARYSDWARHEKSRYWKQKDCPGSILDGLTASERISVWEIQEDKSNLNRVIGSLASGLDKLTNIDFVLLHEEEIRAVGIKIEKSKGNTKDPEISAEWHRDLVNPSGKQLVELAAIIKNGDWGAKDVNEVGHLILGSIGESWVDRNGLKATLVHGMWKERLIA